MAVRKTGHVLIKYLRLGLFYISIMINLFIQNHLFDSLIFLKHLFMDLLKEIWLKIRSSHSCKALQTRDRKAITRNTMWNTKCLAFWCADNMRHWKVKSLLHCSCISFYLKWGMVCLCFENAHPWYCRWSFWKSSEDRCGCLDADFKYLSPESRTPPLNAYFFSKINVGMNFILHALSSCISLTSVCYSHCLTNAIGALWGVVVIREGHEIGTFQETRPSL